MGINKESKKITFDQERCKGCQICTTVCPKKILIMADQINHQGYHPVTITDYDKCISCGLCALVCPDLVIKVYKVRS